MNEIVGSGEGEVGNWVYWLGVNTSFMDYNWVLYLSSG